MGEQEEGLSAVLSRGLQQHGDYARLEEGYTVQLGRARGTPPAQVVHEVPDQQG